MAENLPQIDSLSLDEECRSLYEQLSLKDKLRTLEAQLQSSTPTPAPNPVNESDPRQSLIDQYLEALKKIKTIHDSLFPAPSQLPSQHPTAARLQRPRFTSGGTNVRSSGPDPKIYTIPEVASALHQLNQEIKSETDPSEKPRSEFEFKQTFGHDSNKPLPAEYFRSTDIDDKIEKMLVLLSTNIKLIVDLEFKRLRDTIVSLVERILYLEWENKQLRKYIFPRENYS